jgi:hypothetical protein
MVVPERNLPLRSEREHFTHHRVVEAVALTVQMQEAVVAAEVRIMVEVPAPPRVDLQEVTRHPPIHTGRYEATFFVQKWII